MELLHDLAIPLLEMYLKKPKTLTQKNYGYLCPFGVIYNSQDTEAAQVPFNRWMDKEAVVRTYSGLLLSHKKSEVVTICDSMDGRSVK